MKKLLLAVVAAFLLSGCVSCQTLKPAESAPVGESSYKAYVRSIPVEVVSTNKKGESVSKTHEEYSIYIGNEETEQYDWMMFASGVQVMFQFVHPPEYLEEYDLKPEKRWYAFFMDSRQGISMVGEMLSEEVWSSIPTIAKHVIVGLGVDDENLIYVSVNGLTGSVMILYHPKYDRNKKFYERKFKVLKEYFESHDLMQDIPLSSLLSRIV